MNDNKFYKVYDAYGDVFNDAFPMMHYDGYSKEEMYDMMRECIAQNKPASELYPVNREVKY